jgi:hypothetical protein
LVNPKQSTGRPVQQCTGRSVSGTKLIVLREFPQMLIEWTIGIAVRFRGTDPGAANLTYRGSPMKTALALLTLLLTSIASGAQDIRVRVEAVHLLERGNAVTTPVKYPDLERVDSFQVFGADQAVKEGTFTRVVIQGTGRRDETTFGDYHLVDVIANGGMSRAQNQAVAPPEIKTLMRVTPIYHVSFNNEDVIHAITNREVNGQAARASNSIRSWDRKARPTISAWMPLLARLCWRN